MIEFETDTEYSSKAKTVGVSSAFMIIVAYYGELVVTGNLKLGLLVYFHALLLVQRLGASRRPQRGHKQKSERGSESSDQDSACYDWCQLVHISSGVCTSSRCSESMRRVHFLAFRLLAISYLISSSSAELAFTSTGLSEATNKKSERECESSDQDGLRLLSAGAHTWLFTCSVSYRSYCPKPRLLPACISCKLC